MKKLIPMFLLALVVLSVPVFSIADGSYYGYSDLPSCYRSCDDIYIDCCETYGTCVGLLATYNACGTDLLECYNRCDGLYPREECPTCPTCGGCPVCGSSGTGVSGGVSGGTCHYTIQEIATAFQSGNAIGGIQMLYTGCFPWWLIIILIVVALSHNKKLDDIRRRIPW
jgi:hypothetical protein